ncbi:MAG: DUF4215 domain-containing protein [Kofleriaceae bacterium]
MKIALVLAAVTSVAIAGPTHDPDEAERLARSYLRDHPELGDDFTLVSNTLDGEIRSVGFQQRAHGFDVEDGQIGFVFSHDHLTAILPHVIPADRVTPKRARSRRIDNFTGTLDYNAGLRYASGPRFDSPAHSVNLTANTVATTTDANGVFSFTGANPAQVTATCVGTNVSVTDQAGNATASLQVQAGNGAIWNVANDELADAQVSTFVYGTTAVEHARTLDPAITSWTQPFHFYVNETNPCNAFTNRDDVHLSKATDDCENTGRVADIVYHEFGHAIHDHEIIAGVGMYVLAASEGFADFNAASITNDTGIGRGLYFDDSPAREIDPPNKEYRYPDDVVLDAHGTGMIVSGALWDLRKAVGVDVANQIFYGVMRRSYDLPSTYTAALIADDDDGDLTNGSPHFCAIQRAFGIHGLAADFADTTIGTPTLVDGIMFSVPITTPAAGMCPARTVTSIHVQWKIGDAINDLDLAAGDPAWTAMIPAQPEGTIVQYNVKITLDDGTIITRPDNPADPMYQAFIGTSIPLYCTSFDTDPMWTRSGTNPAEWQWARPNINGKTSGDPTTTYDGGLYIYGTNLVNAGAYGAGENVTVTTPVIDTIGSANIHLQYWRWLTVDAAMNDQATITANGYHLWSNDGQLQHVDKEWRFHDVDLTGALDENGQISVDWNLVTDGTTELGGWNLDNMCIVGFTKVPRCGDGVVDANETCDDGNTVSNDGCDNTCHFELTATGAGCCSASGDPIGISAGASALLLGLRRRDRVRPRSRNTRADRADRSRRRA